MLKLKYKDDKAMIGLKRGEVCLIDHEIEWEENAFETILALKNIFGDVARDIQHVGSTSIKSIKAKPIIDIAVSVINFDLVRQLFPVIEKIVFYYRTHDGDYEQMLFAEGSVYDGTGDLQTHFVHVTIENGEVWKNYINFRDYLNENPNVAKEYEALKIHLKATIPQAENRNLYTAGKADFIINVLHEASDIKKQETP